MPASLDLPAILARAALLPERNFADVCALVAEVERLTKVTQAAAAPLGWRRLVGDEYKSKWCAPCTGGADKPGVWAHWERSDGLTACGEFHKPEDYPIGVGKDRP